mmetsp:Transcript_14093/g.34368  ORF Transcript_14093/g.34368 Transcript_14093/m.34368 type:complete len:240 (-) Transcript_14093:420-1139(-)
MAQTACKIPQPVPLASGHKSDASKQLDSKGQRHEVVTVFDWDDTLLPSSFLSSNGYSLDSEKSMSDEMKEQLAQLEKSVVGFVEMALKKGDKVYIITNAEAGWVELSAQKFMPAVVPLLSRLEVVSARSTYEDRYPESPLQWKYYAFQHNLAKAFSNDFIAKSVISFGDSHVERQVVRAVAKSFRNSLAKSIKFAERPSLEQLRRQVELVIKCFQNIYCHPGDLDLMLTISLTGMNPKQ